MKTTFLMIMLSSFLALPSFARVTIYATRDAVNQVVVDAKLANLEAQYGPLAALTVKERYDSNALQAFEVNLTLTAQTPIGPRSCFVDAHVFVVKDEAAPRGVIASKILDPNFGVPNCQR